MNGERYWGETDRANARFYRWMDAATVAFAASIALTPFDDARPVAMVLTLAWFLILVSMPGYKGKDEWAELCWRRAAAAAFLVFLAMPVVASIGQLLYARLRGGPAQVADVSASVQLAIFNASWLVGVGALLGVFQWTRLRGPR